MFDLRHAQLGDRPGVADLLQRCEAVDGWPPLSEYKVLRVPVANSVRTIVAEDAGLISVLGVAAWHPAEIGEAGGYWAAEIAIDPRHRSVGAYEAVLAALDAELGAVPSLWTFDDTQAAAATAHGMRQSRGIVQMKLPLPADATEFRNGVGVRPFVVGEDEPAWLLLNQEVFGDHPEAGAIDAADLALRMSQPWFDPDGFLLLLVEGEPAGYCWTKRHTDDVGEIYMIGLAPRHRGRGLARPLTAAGLDYLAHTGASEAILYAETANVAAINLYESMGFEIVRKVALFASG